MSLLGRRALAAEPDWLAPHYPKHRPAVLASKEPLVELDRPEAVQKAIDWLTRHAPEAVEGAAGDQTTYKVAAQVRDFGLSAATAFDVIAEHWNEAGKASPPWPADELMQKVEHAYRYGQNAPGNALGIAQFDDTTGPDFLEPVKTDDSGKPKGLYFVPIDAALGHVLAVPKDPLVEGLLDRGSTSVVYGASNVGKTFVALDIAYHIGAGRPWQGRDVTAGLVVYVAAEGGHGILRRAAALQVHYGAGAKLVVVPCPVNLRDGRADIVALIALVGEAEAAMGAPAQMVVIDTLSRALAGGDENGPADMGAFVRNVDKIRAATGAALMIVHHSGKDAARGARGHSLLRAATDTEIEVADGAIKITKQRDMEAGKDQAFKLVEVAIGTDPKGRRITSCIIQIVTGNEFVKVELSGRDAAFLEAFKDAAQATAEELGDLTNWRQTPTEWAAWVDAYKATKPDAAKGIDRTSLSKMRSAVLESGWVLKTKEDRYVLA